MNSFLFKLGIAPLMQYEHFRGPALCASADEARDAAAAILGEKPSHPEAAVQFPNLAALASEPEALPEGATVPETEKEREVFI